MFYEGDTFFFSAKELMFIPTCTVHFAKFFCLHVVLA